MENSKALSKLREAADLIGMIEELTNPGTLERLSGASWSGLRITLRNAKETILASHDSLAHDLIERSRAARLNGRPSESSTSSTSSEESKSPIAAAQAKRPDLRSAIERVGDK